MITRDNVTDRDTTRAFGREVLLCPDCDHGIDPHGADPGGPCGVSGCPCLMQPNGIASLLVDQAEARGAADAYADVMRRAADQSMAAKRIAEAMT